MSDPYSGPSEGAPSPQRRASEVPASAPPVEKDAWQAAADYGIDMNQLEYLMGLTPAERIAGHQQALELVLALERAGQRYYGIDARSPDPIDEAQG